MRQGFWDSFNKGYLAGERLWKAQAANAEQQDIADAYKSGEGLGAVTPEEYLKTAASLEETNPEAAAIYRQAAQFNYEVPTDTQRKAQGLGAISDYYRRSGKIDKALEFDTRRAQLEDIEANRRWREELQNKQREEWDRERQMREVLARTEGLSPVSYAATQEALGQLGPEGYAAREIYKNYFSRSYPDALRDASNKLAALGYLPESNAMAERAKRMQEEGVDKVVSAIRSGATGGQVLDIFNQYGQMRFDNPPIIEKVYDPKDKTKVIDYRVAGTINDKPFVINSLNEWELQNLPTEKQKELGLSKERLDIERGKLENQQKYYDYMMKRLDQSLKQNSAEAKIEQREAAIADLANSLFVTGKAKTPEDARLMAQQIYHKANLDKLGLGWGQDPLLTSMTADLAAAKKRFETGQTDFQGYQNETAAIQAAYGNKRRELALRESLQNAKTPDDRLNVIRDALTIGMPLEVLTTNGVTQDELKAAKKRTAKNSASTKPDYISMLNSYVQRSEVPDEVLYDIAKHGTGTLLGALADPTGIRELAAREYNSRHPDRPPISY